MIVKEKTNCTVTILDRSELGLNSSPFLNTKTADPVKSIDSEIHILMNTHGMTYEEAAKTHRENMEWAM